MNGTKLTGEIGHINKELSSVELARIEFEKNLEEDPNNEWLKRVIAGLKMAEQSLRRLEVIENAKPCEAMGCLKRVWNDVNTQNNFRQDFKNLTIVENYILKAQEQEELLSYITGFIDDVEISDNGVCYVSFENNTPYLDCIEMDEDHYNKFKKIKESQKGE
jgi:hypothetical protein